MRSLQTLRHTKVVIPSITNYIHFISQEFEFFSVFIYWNIIALNYRFTDVLI